MSGVFYGSFDLDNHSTPPTGYYVQSRPLGNMKKQQNLVPIARYEGVKKTGEWIGERTIQLQVKVVGSSRANLESLLDALYLALDQEQQHLVLHSDGRYFVADAIYAPAPLGIGNILACTVPIDFVCQQPYAYSASGSGPYDTGDLVLSLDSGMRAYPGGRSIPNTTYVFPPFLSITGGGTAFSRPTMKIYNKRVALSGIQLTTALLQNTVYTSIMVGALNAPLYPGDTLTMALNHTPPQQGDPSQTLTVSQLANVGDTTINVNSFTANY